MKRYFCKLLTNVRLSIFVLLQCIIESFYSLHLECVGLSIFILLLFDCIQLTGHKKTEFALKKVKASRNRHRECIKREEIGNHFSSRFTEVEPNRSFLPIVAI